jgi:Ca-activated chloride channel homolog
MFRSRKFLVLIIGFLFIGLAFYGLSISNAQQMPPNPKTVSASPNPTVTPTPNEVIEEDDDILRIETELVNVLFTATDKTRRLISDLKKEDVRLLEDGQPQEIINFQRQVDLPLSLAILIDTSISQERTLPDEKSAAKSFLEDVVRPSKDEVAIISFTGESTLEQGMTNNIGRLRRAVDRIEFTPPSGHIGAGVIVGTPPASGRNRNVQGSTAIWDSIWITADEILGTSPDKTRRAIILLSDGADTSSNKKLDEAVQAALKAEAIIYSIGVGDDYYGGVDSSSLRKISERTGGRAYFPRSESELRQAFTQIQIDMRSQYLISYEPTNPKKDGTFRKIEVQFTNPEMIKQKSTINHRQGYFAKTESKPIPKTK